MIGLHSSEWSGHRCSECAQNEYSAAMQNNLEPKSLYLRSGIFTVQAAVETSTGGDRSKKNWHSASVTVLHSPHSCS